MLVIQKCTMKTKRKSLDMEHLDVPMLFKKINLNKSNKTTVISNFKIWLKKENSETRNIVLNELRKQTSDITWQRQLLNWQEIQQLNDEGYTIGSHTNTHPLLDHLTEEDCKKELKISFDILNKKLGKTPTTIAYPNGNYNNIIIKLAEEVGYNLGLAVGEKFDNLESNSKFSIPRMQLGSNANWKNKLKVIGVNNCLVKLWN